LIDNKSIVNPIQPISKHGPRNTEPLPPENKNNSDLVDDNNNTNTSMPFGASGKAIADTACTVTIGGTDAPVVNCRPTKNPISIRIPNGEIMRSTHEAEIDVPLLPAAARHVHIVPECTTPPLISIGQLCDADCDVTLNAKTISVSHNNKVVLTGKRTAETRLWQFDLPVPIETERRPQQNNYALGAVETRTPKDLSEAVQHDEIHNNSARAVNDAVTAIEFIEIAYAAIGTTTAEQLVEFAHAALFSPVLSTLETALERGYVNGFPGLSVKTLRKYPPQSAAMVKGHLDRTRKNVRSTKGIEPTFELEMEPVPAEIPAKVAETIPEASETFPTSTSLKNKRTNLCYAAIHDAQGQVFSDQSGRFLIPSSAGNQYVVLVYDVDSNAILTEAIPNRLAASIRNGYRKIHNRLVRAGCRPRLQRMDNECSDMLKDFMEEESIDYQIVAQSAHYRNIAERCMRTWKNHFIAGLCSLDPAFPLHLWDKLLPQAELTLNLLWGS
jgi:hypothetical protein